MAHNSFRAVLASRVNIRFNAPLSRFAFQPRECATSRQEFLCKNFFSARIQFLPGILPRFCFPAGFQLGSWKRLFWRETSRYRFLGGFLAKMNGMSFPEIFPGKDPAGKTGLFGRISVGSGVLCRILPGSQYLFYKGTFQCPNKVVNGLRPSINWYECYDTIFTHNVPHFFQSWVIGIKFHK